MPRDVVAGQGWTADTELELVSSPDGVLIRPKAATEGTERAATGGGDEISYEEFRRSLPKHDGRPPLTDAEIKLILEEEAVRRHLARTRGAS